MKYKAPKTMTEKDTPYMRLAEQGAMLYIIALLAFIVSLVFLLSPIVHKPVTRADAPTYRFEFDFAESGKNYMTVYARTGEVYDIYPHTLEQGAMERILSVERGTPVSVAVHPESGYVIEMKIRDETVLDFDTYMSKNYKYQFGYVFIGVILVLCGIMLIILPAFEKSAHTAMREKQAERKKKRASGGGDTPIRAVENERRGRVFLTAEYEGHSIVYRRYKMTNELIIDGNVYDEIHGFFEFKHKLTAEINGRKISAGFDGNSMSYIKAGSRTVAKKERII